MLQNILKHLVAFSLRKKLITSIAFIWLIVRWLGAAGQLPVDVLPDLNRPRVTIFAWAEWRATEEIEQLITSPVERVVNGAPGVVAVRSSTAIGQAVINVEFDWWTDVYRNRQVISELLQTVSLPEDAHITMWPTTSLLWEIVWVGVNSPQGTVDWMELRSIAEWQVKQQLMTIPGIAQVIVMWWDPKEYQIRIDPERLIQHDITLDEVYNAIEFANENRGWGFLTNQQTEAPIRILSRTADVNELRKLVVAHNDTRSVSLQDVANVAFGPNANRRGDASINGKDGVILRIIKQPWVNTLAITEKIDETIASIQWSLIEDVAVNSHLFRQERFISSGLDNVTDSLRDGIIVIIIVITIFLMNGRMTLITLLSIPFSLLIAFIIFRLMWLGINTMTLWWFTLAIGELVDDSIVWAENIFRRLRQNYLLKKEEQQWSLKVVYDAINEVRWPIIYTTFLGILAFLPFMMLGWVDGKLLSPVWYAYIISLIASTLISVTILPVLASFLLPKYLKKRAEKYSKKLEENTNEKENDIVPWMYIDDTKFVKALKKLVLWPIKRSINHPKLALLGMLLMIPVTLFLYSSAWKEWLPPFNEPTFTIGVMTPLGSSLQYVRDLTDEFSIKLLAIPGIEWVWMTAWRAEADAHANGANIGELEVHFDTSYDKESITRRIQEVVHEYEWIAFMSIWQPITHRMQELVSGIRAPIVVKVFGHDLDISEEIANEILHVMQETNGVVNAQLAKEFRIPQLWIQLKKDSLLTYGIESSELIENLENSLLWVTISEVVDDQTRFPLVLKLDPERRGDIRQIASLPVATAEWQTITLQQIADIRMIEGQNIISHDDMQRRRVVSAFSQWRDVVSVVEEIKEKVDKIQLPIGYYVSFEWDYAAQKEATRRIVVLALFILIAIAFVLHSILKKWLLVWQVLLDVITAFLWWLIAIWITGWVISTAHLVWFVSLLGIVSRSWILLIEHYIQLLEDGWMKRWPELITRGSLERIVPVMMTTCTSWLSLLPLIIASGEAGKEILGPIAIVTFWWLIMSSLVEVFTRPGIVLWMNSEESMRKRGEEIELED